MDKDEPFGLIDECIFNMDGECEILIILGVEEHGFEELGDLLDGDEEVDGPLRLPDSQPQEQQQRSDGLFTRGRLGFSSLLSQKFG